MYCPRCGQQQATDSMRFCSRCGMPMEGTMHLLANGGMLPAIPQIEGEQGRSARAKGVMQGFILFLLGIVIVPILGIMARSWNVSAASRSMTKERPRRPPQEMLG